MIDCFKNDVNHFKTFSGERNSSFSANCNALNALLHSPDVNQYTAVIVSSANFLCDLWWSGEVSDKWVSISSY